MYIIFIILILPINLQSTLKCDQSKSQSEANACFNICPYECSSCIVTNNIMTKCNYMNQIQLDYESLLYYIVIDYYVLLRTVKYSQNSWVGIGFNYQNVRSKNCDALVFDKNEGLYDGFINSDYVMFKFKIFKDKINNVFNTSTFNYGTQIVQTGYRNLTSFDMNTINNFPVDFNLTLNNNITVLWAVGQYDEDQPNVFSYHGSSRGYTNIILLNSASCDDICGPTNCQTSLAKVFCLACPSGYFSQSHQCQRCSYMCKECYGEGDYNCILCDENEKLVGSFCIQEEVVLQTFNNSDGSRVAYDSIDLAIETQMVAYLSLQVIKPKQILLCMQSPLGCELFIDTCDNNLNYPTSIYQISEDMEAQVCTKDSVSYSNYQTQMNKLYNKINSYCINTISFDHDELQYIMQAVLGLAKSYMYNNPKKYKQILNLNQQCMQNINKTSFNNSQYALNALVQIQMEIIDQKENRGYIQYTDFQPVEGALNVIGKFDIDGNIIYTLLQNKFNLWQWQMTYDKALKNSIQSITNFLSNEPQLFHLQNSFITQLVSQCLSDKKNKNIFFIELFNININTGQPISYQYYYQTKIFYFYTELNIAAKLHSSIQSTQFNRYYLYYFNQTHGKWTSVSEGENSQNDFEFVVPKNGIFRIDFMLYKPVIIPAKGLLALLLEQFAFILVIIYESMFGLFILMIIGTRPIRKDVKDNKNRVNVYEQMKNNFTIKNLDDASMKETAKRYNEEKKDLRSSNDSGGKPDDYEVDADEIIENETAFNKIYNGKQQQNFQPSKIKIQNEAINVQTNHQYHYGLPSDIDHHDELNGQELKIMNNKIENGHENEKMEDSPPDNDNVINSPQNNLESEYEQKMKQGDIEIEKSDQKLDKEQQLQKEKEELENEERELERELEEEKQEMERIEKEFDEQYFEYSSWNIHPLLSFFNSIGPYYNISYSIYLLLMLSINYHFTMFYVSTFLYFNKDWIKRNSYYEPYFIMFYVFSMICINLTQYLIGYLFSPLKNVKKIQGVFFYFEIHWTFFVFSASIIALLDTTLFFYSKWLIIDATIQEYILLLTVNIHVMENFLLELFPLLVYYILERNNLFRLRDILMKLSTYRGFFELELYREWQIVVVETEKYYDQ